ncbi:polygalacturonase [Phytophthora cinnamomi]|uniref:polygalacturonase n=1 Tax=Phytophthora cinnamomi TaxID=4785 RepID=UPI00355A110F|nr:polygalacturonase [Phytophthora cinnamomi]UKP15078.1 polygalacturonase [Phytophthora cinnamomi]
MKFFSALFTITMVIANVMIADSSIHPSEDCNPGFPLESRSNYKQGVVTTVEQKDPSNAGQSSPVQDTPNQNNPGQDTYDESSEGSDGSPKQTPPVLKGACTLTGDYINNTDVSECSTIIVDSLRVPAGVTLNLTDLQDHAKITFQGTSTFAPMGAWYWPQGQKVTKPVFFRILNTTHSTFTGFNMLNMPYRTFSVWDSNHTTISGLTLNSSAGDGVAKNTDGFDLSRNNHLTITKNRVYNQDDCLAMQSSRNTVFSDNYCCGSHGISIGSLGGPVLNWTTTVNGLRVTGNTIVNSTNGIRIKTIIGLKGLVTNAVYTNNTLINVTNAIVMHSDYNKTKGGYAGKPTSLVKITNIKIDGLKGTAKNLYDIVANPDVVSDWSFTNIDVAASSNGNCTGEPYNVPC